MQHVVEAIYKMVGHMVIFPPDEATPQQRVDKLFELMDQASAGTLGHLQETTRGMLFV